MDARGFLGQLSALLFSAACRAGSPHSNSLTPFQSLEFSDTLSGSGVKELDARLEREQSATWTGATPCLLVIPSIPLRSIPHLPHGPHPAYTLSTRCCAPPYGERAALLLRRPNPWPRAPSRSPLGSHPSSRRPESSQCNTRRSIGLSEALLPRERLADACYKYKSTAFG